ncbi:kinase domain-containing protein [Hyaloscypha finlandica]|nr:kinase domain-containing protein [Hyaloscypha finlandica]
MPSPTSFLHKREAYTDKYSATGASFKPQPASQDDILYRPVEEAEPVEKYAPGGFHPVQLEDVLSNGRYLIVHKLGFGGFSTVWLARGIPENQYVALKICVASSHEELEEHQILSRIKSQSDNQPGGNLMHLPFDSFTITGPNGVHTCFASAPGRCSIAESKFYSDGVWLFPLETARAITAQLILAVSFLHSIGIAHGDLHIGNVILALPDISSLTVEDLNAQFGEPQKEPVIRLDDKPISHHVPPYVMRGAWLGKPCEHVTLSDARVLVTDFGESWQPSSRPCYHLRIPMLYRSPEALFAEKEGTPIGLAADVWALACVIYDLFAKGTLFECFVPDADDVFAENISLLGKPPQRWWDMWEAKGDFFNENGEWNIKSKRVSDGKYMSMKTRMGYIAEDREGSITGEELEDLTGLLEQMLRWLPDDRATAEELTNGRWMQKWGLPALESIERAGNEDIAGKFR